MRNTKKPHFKGSRRTFRPQWRMLGWGGCAMAAVAAVVFLSQTGPGNERLEQAFAALTERPPTVAVLPKPALAQPAANAGTERLAARVRQLTADRDRLNARVADLEHQLADVTGSIARAPAPLPAAPPAAAPVPPPSVTPAPATRSEILLPAMPRQIAAVLPPPGKTPPMIVPLAAPAAGDITVHWSDLPKLTTEPTPKPETKPEPKPAPVAAVVPMPPARPLRVASVTPPVRRAAAPVRHRLPTAAPRPETGLDIGGSLSTSRLTNRWTEVKANFGPMLTGLRPVIARDGRFGHMPYRLVIGPVANDEAMARLCASLIPAGFECRPVPFEGRQLAQY
jgi:hypothetical protein